MRKCEMSAPAGLGQRSALKQPQYNVRFAPHWQGPLLNIHEPEFSDAKT